MIPHVDLWHQKTSMNQIVGGLIIPRITPNELWLVVSTPLKNISQCEGLSHILWKIKNVPKPPTSNLLKWPIGTEVSLINVA